MKQPARRLYLDNAATSFPKPDAVVRAMVGYATGNGASPRGRFAEAREAGALLTRCRDGINRLINGESADHVVFTLNTTDALNLAIKGSLGSAAAGYHGVRVGVGGAGYHVVTTWLDHNSVLRPVAAMVGRDLGQTRIEANGDTAVIHPAAVAAAVTSKTMLVVINHASNVTGAIQPVKEIVAAVRERAQTMSVPFGTPLVLLDAAQSMGHIPVDVRELDVDLVAFPGHKGLLGPTGTGGLYIRPGVEKRLANVREGGTGTGSESEAQPTVMPDRFESGSHNTIGIAGLGAGVAWLLERGMDFVREHELRLINVMLEGVRGARGLRLLGPEEPERRVGVFSFVHDEICPADMAAILESQFGILCRAGLHCAPLAHESMGTAPPLGQGAVRLSIGPFTRDDGVRFAAAALREICG
ncbi:MAG: aminotransferase class V-fold PLP-dependent enzyme [Phycisphaerales bacterium]|nr:aminotransferase class V-fold PLP-dependent enzyme [Phycisphaerales bacterium]